MYFSSACVKDNESYLLSPSYWLAICRLEKYHNNCICSYLTFVGESFIYRTGELQVSYYSAFLCVNFVSWTSAWSILGSIPLLYVLSTFLPEATGLVRSQWPLQSIFSSKEPLLILKVALIRNFTFMFRGASFAETGLNILLKGYAEKICELFWFMNRWPATNKKWDRNRRQRKRNCLCYVKLNKEREDLSTPNLEWNLWPPIIIIIIIVIIITC